MTFPEVAEPLDGPVCEEFATTARRHGFALVAGVVETSGEPSKAYNTLVPDGDRLASTGRFTCSMRRALESRPSSSRVRPPDRWCSSAGERASA